SAQTATATGRSIARGSPGTAQGGLDTVVGGLDGRGCGLDLIGLDQGTPDVVTGYRVRLWTNWPQTQEARLLTAVDGGTLTPNPVVYRVGVNSSFQFDLSKPGLLYVAFLSTTTTSFRPVGPIVGFKS